MMFYTYVYFSSCDASVPTYVGKGKNNRHLDHFKPSHRSYFANHLRKQQREDSEVFPMFFRIAHDSETAAYEEEIRLIKHYGRRDLKTGCLYNRTPGGDGRSGPRGPMSEAQKELRRQKRFGPMSAERKAKIATKAKSRWADPEYRAKMGSAISKGMKRGVIDATGQ